MNTDTPSQSADTQTPVPAIDTPLRMESDPSPEAAPLRIDDVLTGASGNGGVAPESLASGIPGNAGSGSNGSGGGGPGGIYPGPGMPGPSGPGVVAGGWLWVPGAALNRPWRKRHPVLFWAFLLLLLFGVTGYAAQWAIEEGPLSKQKIAVINVEGVILDSEAVVGWIEAVRANPRISGAVVRVNSPGGAVGPSQEIYRAVKRLATEKYTVVSMGAVAASGGYYVALGGREIFAGPSTLTGSIGVKMQIPNIEKLMGTIGISEKTLATGELKDAGSSWRAMRPEEEAYLKDLMNDMYEAFLAVVAENRAMSPDKARPLADGRAMTGRQALAVGLVDKLGDKQDAIERVRAHYTLPFPPTVVEGPEAPEHLLKEMIRSLLSLEAEQRVRNDVPQFLY